MLLEKSFRIEVSNQNELQVFVDLAMNILISSDKLSISYKKMNNPEVLFEKIKLIHSPVEMDLKYRIIELTNVSKNTISELINITIKSAENFSDIIFSIYLIDSNGDYPDCLRIRWYDALASPILCIELYNATDERVNIIKSKINLPLTYLSQ